jgi:hypothetical protein
MPLLSSFFLTLLEYYGLQLQHLSPNSITLVAILVHFCKMFVGVWPSVRLFRCFIGGYYLQCQTHGLSRYIVHVSPGRWEHWRDDWALVQADAHNWLTLPVTAPTLDNTEWGKDPDLESGFDPVLHQIRYLAENCLTSLMVLHDFLSKRLVPLQDRPRPVWMYTRVNDFM